LRDSGDDEPDEVKLYKLKTFPFFENEDYKEVLEKVRLTHLRPQVSRSKISRQGRLEKN
jgi:hypothetical protein